MEAALLAPFVVLALLSRSLLRETTRHRYRWAGMAISLAASIGVVAMLLSGLVPVDLEEAMDTLLGHVVPALVFLSACALLYGGLIWLAQHGRLEAFMPPSDARANRAQRD
jgi:NhaP-type Na+/H+ or K+/H+ antiporter